jgi:creatinine amidohydrolase
MDMDMEHAPRHALWDMTWTELDAAAHDIDLVLFPVGSTVQHGPNSVFSSDAVRANEFALKIAERLYPRVLVAPVMPFGIANHHMSFPGTISLSPETFTNVLFEVVESLAEHGFDRFLFVNAHSGNEAALDLLLGRLRNKLDLSPAWVSISALAGDATQPGGRGEASEHAGQSEISQLLYLAPWTVRTGALVSNELLEQEYPFTSPEGPIHVAYTFDELTANGVIGDARAASAELGERIVTIALDRVCTFVKVFFDGDAF